jgi:hypothetical protein
MAFTSYLSALQASLSPNRAKGHCEIKNPQQLFHSAAAGGRICWDSTVLSGWIFSGRSFGRADGLSFSRIT